MVYQARARKRVFARRAADGSAFEKCSKCGVSVAIALSDMHECEEGAKGDSKRQKVECGFVEQDAKQRFQDQPRSAFLFFMESISEICNGGDMIDVNRKGFETWKNMSKEERKPYALQAERVNFAYTEALLREAEELELVDDEADSSFPWKYDEIYKDDKYYDDSDTDCSGIFWSETSDRLNISEWENKNSWIFGESS